MRRSSIAKWSFVLTTMYQVLTTMYQVLTWFEGMEDAQVIDREMVLVLLEV